MSAGTRVVLEIITLVGLFVSLILAMLFYCMGVA